MIVQIRLSIPDKEYENVNYYVNKLRELAKAGYPGNINFHFVGMQGTTAASRKKQQQNNTIQNSSELFS